jgi:hypothetical protein
MTEPRTVAVFAALAASLAMLAACHSYHVDVTVENHTGSAIDQLEIDYPSASFGANSLAPGASLHYRVQLRGSGPLTAQYRATDGKTVHVDGPTVSEGQEGQLEIVFTPQGKADFLPRLTPLR